MQVISLEWEGIGPFATRQNLDVATLGAGGLFLLEGPTGAGKTTIVDALVFALYGDVAGADSSKDRLASTKLPPGVEPFVEATIETARGLYRVRRVPTYERPKSRGTGTTLGRASIRLWKLPSPDDPGVLLSTSFQEAGAELQQAIGLTKEQFTQTVVLPQSGFATFLRAKPEDRRAVLQDIFGTEFYARCAEQLAELAAGHRAAATNADAALERAAATFIAAGWSGQEQGLAVAERWADGDDEALLAEAAARTVELSGSAEAAATEATRAAAAATEAAAELHAVQVRRELVLERAELLSRAAELASGQAAVEVEAASLLLAERAERVRPGLVAGERAERARRTASQAWQAAMAEVSDGPDIELAALDAEGLATAVATGREERSALAAWVALEAGLSAREDALRADRAAWVRGQAEVEQERVQAGAERAEADGLAAELIPAETLAGTLAEGTAAADRAQRLRDARVALEELLTELRGAQAEEAGRARVAELAAASYRSARVGWLDALAGTLAAELTDGAPCPVCGATEHPAPTRRPPGAADEAEVSELEEAARAAEGELAQARSVCDALAGAIGTQRELAGESSLEQAEQDLAAAVQVRNEAEAAAVRVGELRRNREALLERATDRERALAQTEQQLAARGGALAELADRLAADRVAVAEQAGGHASVAARVAGLDRRLGVAVRLGELGRAADEAQTEAEQRAAELAAILADQGFATAAAAREALLDEVDRERRQARVNEHQAQRAAVAQRLAEPRLVAVADAEPVEVAPWEERATQARSIAAQAERHRGGAEAAATAAAQAGAELVRCVSVRRQAVELAEPYLAMAELARAGATNLSGVTLPTYVLLRRFEEVVDLANVRLDAMTGGRYSLRRTDAREGRSQKLGLGLEVVDHLAGDRARDPRTLSGGETFQASLAMALGLADAVSAEAGGVELNTLFVDEGFGSLDAEALDQVMGQLTALRDSGRCVGVISHVAELKQRIADRVTVVPLRDGTSTLRCSVDRAG